MAPTRQVLAVHFAPPLLLESVHVGSYACTCSAPVTGPAFCKVLLSIRPPSSGTLPSLPTPSAGATLSQSPGSAGSFLRFALLSCLRSWPLPSPLHTLPGHL